MAVTRPGPTAEPTPICAIGPDLWYQREAEGDYRIGLTEAAARRAGRIVRFRGPTEGRRYAARESAASIESEKWVGHLATPVAGTVVATNARAEADPSLIAHDPLGAGWLYRLHPNESDALEALARPNEDRAVDRRP